MHLISSFQLLQNYTYISEVDILLFITEIDVLLPPQTAILRTNSPFAIRIKKLAELHMEHMLFSARELK